MEKEMQPQTNPRKRKIKKGRAFLFFLFLIVVFSGIGYGGWKGYQSYHSPWGEKIPDSFSRLPDSEFSKQFLNILIVGVGDEEEGRRLPDTFLVLSIDRRDHQFTFVLIPPDIVLKEKKTEFKTLRDIYLLEGKEENLLTIEQLLQVPVQHYLTFRADTLPYVIDALGGIEVYVEKDLNYSDSLMNPPLEIHLKKGMQRLNGDQISQFLRFQSDELGELGRLKRQQLFLKSFHEQTGKLSIMARSPWVINSLVGRVETDMSMNDFVDIFWHIWLGKVQTEIYPIKLEKKRWIPSHDSWQERASKLFPVIIKP